VTSPQTQAARLRFLPVLEGLLVAGAVSLYDLLRVGPSLRYHHAVPVFQFGQDFLHGFLSRPGGLLEHAAAFLAQLDYHAWLGATVLGILAGALFLAAGLYLNQVTGVRVRAVPYALPVLLLVLANRYDAPVFEIGLGLFLALGLACVHLLIAVPWRRTWLRLGTFWLLEAGLFLVAGAAPSLLLALWGGCAELFCRKRLPAALGCWLTMLLLPCWEASFPEFMWKSPLARWGNGWTFYALAALCLALPAVLVSLTRWREMSEVPGGVSPSRRTRPHKEVLPAKSKAVWLRPVSCAVFAITGVALVVFTFDPNQKALVQLDYFARRGNWEQVLAAAARLPQCPAPARLNITRALFHTGRLGNNLFTLPLTESLDLNPEMKESWGMYLPLSEAMLELGQLNLAEHFGHEALELEGRRPAILRQLARIQVLKHRPQAAQMFLNVLRRIPFQGGSPPPGPLRMETDPGLTPDENAERLVPFLVTTDYPASRVTPEVLLQQLLHTNRRNQMAFEYLMAHYLLSRQLEKFSRELTRLDDFGYPAIPRHYEEAILVCRSLDSGPPVDLRGRRISVETTQRFERFRQLLEAQERGTAGIKAKLARDYGDTFWYHYLSGESPGPSGQSSAKSQR